MKTITLGEDMAGQQQFVLSMLLPDKQYLASSINAQSDA